MTVTNPAIFASAFHPHVGGVEELVRQLSLGQRALGMSPTVVTNRYPKDLAHRDVHDGVDVLRYPFRVPGMEARQLAGWAVNTRSTQSDIAAALKTRRADLVHVQCVSSNAYYAVRAAQRLDLPLVVTMQGELSMDAAQVFQRSAQARRIWRGALDAAQIITGCSEYVLREAEAVYGKPFGQRGQVIYNGVALRDFTDPLPADGRPFVLGIGRHVEQKGFDLLLDAFEQIHHRFPDVDLCIAGDGPSRPALEHRAASLLASGRVRFLGKVDHARAVRLFQQAHVFVLPSRHEPQGIVVLEAMAGGAPVLAAKVGGVPEVVSDGTDGVLFDHQVPHSLTEHLSALLADASLRARLAENGRRRAAAFDWSAVTQQYIGCYAAATG